MRLETLIRFGKETAPKRREMKIPKRRSLSRRVNSERQTSLSTQFSESIYNLETKSHNI